MNTRGWRSVADRVLAIVMSLFVVTSICPAWAHAEEDVFDPNKFPPIVAQVGNFSMKRLYGDQRYQTMSSIVGEAFTSSSWAIVTTGEDFPDALCASALAGAKRAPIIITPKGSLSTWASGQLTSLGVKNVLLVGSTSSLTATVEKEVGRLGINVRRIGEGDRHAMSVSVMREVRKAGSKSDAVILATGSNYADALSISPWAYASATPIVLTQGDGALSDTAVRAIKSDDYVKRVIIVGNQNAVNDSVILQLGAGYDYTRLGGPDRYETSMGVAQWEMTQGFVWDTAAIATGKYYPDALTGAALLGLKVGPILLVHDKADPTVALLTEKASQVSTCYVLGGLISVPDALANPSLYLGLPEPTPAVVQPVVTPVVTPQPDTQQTSGGTSQQTDASGSSQQTGDGRWYNTSSNDASQNTSSNAEVFPSVQIVYGKDDVPYSVLCIGKNSCGTYIPDPNEVAPYAYNKSTHKIHLWQCTSGPKIYNTTADKPNGGNWVEEMMSLNDLLAKYSSASVSLCSKCMDPEQ